MECTALLITALITAVRRAMSKMYAMMQQGFRMLACCCHAHSECTGTMLITAMQ